MIAPAEAPRWQLRATDLRIGTGLVLFAYATTHMINHALGLWSFEAMQAGQDLRLSITRNPLGTGVLFTAILVHFALGVASVLRMRSWQMGMRNLVQLGFGLAIPVFLIRHVWDTRGVSELFGIDDSYAYALWGMWPNEGLNQALLMLAVWGHGCVGLHHWLNRNEGYRRTVWLWYGLAVLLPALSYAGFVTAARAFKATGVYRNPFKPGEWDILLDRIAWSETVYVLVLAGLAGIWAMSIARDRLRPRIAVSYAGGTRVLAPPGQTVLDTSRQNRIPHASVCGGRARCSTCRVRVLETAAELPPVGAVEAQVLARVGAPGNVRLACQLRPEADLTVSPLLPGRRDSLRRVRLDRYHWGVEQEVTILFADLRGFTRMSEGKLPFDVVFLLNQFLGQMAGAIEDTGGHVDKFMGDGIMAIYGMDRPMALGAAQAIDGARAMGGVLGSLNQSLREDLPSPLSMGIGLHAGPAILGRIGAAERSEAAAQLTALGETVNVASRLEAATKELGVQAIVSAACMAVSGLTPGQGLVRHGLSVRGKSTTVDVWAARIATDLPDPRAGER
ncbi:MAG: adenylate/guanylate cyclase domain-containing protein [Paracoccaceae bacterium]|nr:MAG: adenylate/guanylate cyclase domain-containing protein [Paracoccaceae bacterium]